MATGRRFLNPKSTLFLLCDIQEKFRAGMPLFNNMVQNANKLVKAGKELDIPLVVTEHYPEKLGPIVSDIDVSHAKALVSKTLFSMITPEVEKTITEISVKNLDVVLFGLESHICVEQTALDLLERNFNVYVVADCSCSRLNQDRDLALERLRQRGCVITTSESIIFNLMRSKEHPKFNSVRKLVNPISADMQLSGNSKL